jgi:hypothetical protein
MPHKCLFLYVLGPALTLIGLAEVKADLTYFEAIFFFSYKIYDLDIFITTPIPIKTSFKWFLTS